MVSMLRIYRDRLATLNRRADYLKERIEKYAGKDSSRDKAELAALAWAIDLIEEEPDAAMGVLRLSNSQGASGDE